MAALATLRSGPDTCERWIGEQCLTGDGSHVVAVVAPWTAQNSEAGIAQRGTAYAVDTRTGAVRALASHLALAYFDPGCGSTSTASLTRYLSPDEATTEVLVAETMTGAATRAGAVGEELTSAVSAGADVLAADDSRLVRLHGGRLETLARLPRPVYHLTYPGGDRRGQLPRGGRREPHRSLPGRACRSGSYGSSTSRSASPM